MAQASTRAQTVARPATITPHKKPERHFQWYKVIIYVFLIVFTLTSLGPFVFSFFASFKTLQHILDFPPSLLPNPWTLGNYQEVLQDGTFTR